MNLLVSLLRDAWARIAQSPQPDPAPCAPTERPQEPDTLAFIPPDGLLDTGLERLRAGDLTAAEKYFAAAAERVPQLAPAHFYHGVALLRQKRYEDAIDCFALADHHHPDFAEARFQLGVAQIHLERFDDAIASFRKVIELRPDYADAHSNLGYVLYKHLELLDEAEAHLRRALELEPGKIEAQTNLAMVLDHRGETDRALELYDRVLRVSPDDSEVRLNRSLILLARGDYARGWPEYEARHAVQLRRDFRLPEWDGASLSGRVILVHAEQGLGDEIMFASCLGEVIGEARHCVIECHRKLEKLFRRSFPAATVYGALQTDPQRNWLDHQPRIDCKVGIGSLPLRFRTSRADFPRHTGYLRADPVRSEYWRGRLRELGAGPKIGISWRGGAKKTRRHARSIPLKDWAAMLALPGIHFVSVQYGENHGDIEALQDVSHCVVHHWPEAIEDYDETAALVTAVDLVISVQTAVIHLGGALGRPVWALVSARPEWRYQETGDSLPWYPSVRLIRQAAPGNWRAVIEECRQRLERWPE
jgi:tetratricopeptide (TPR) repeat protein